MDTKMFLSAVLGLQDSVWYIADVGLDVAGATVDVTLQYRHAPSFVCPECGADAGHSVHDHKERTWRHKDLCEYLTVLHARVPRMCCGSCGKVTQVAVPWAGVMMRVTHAFEVQVLNACALMPLSDVQKMYRVSWYTLTTMIERAVQRHRQNKCYDSIRHLGFDEIALRKGQNDYVTLVYDLDRSEVIWVGQGRGYQTAKSFIAWFGADRFAALESVCCDMWDAYIKAIKEHLEPSRIVFDKFHIKKHLNTAVDDVRKQENREYLQQQDRVLARTKYLWLKNRENLNTGQRQWFRQLLGANLKVGKAYALKEMFDHFWRYRSVTWATKFFDQWHSQIMHGNLAPMKRVAKMLKKYWYGVISYVTHPVTNAKSEGINSKIRGYTKRAFGFRSMHMFQNIVYLTCGGLDLHPLKSR